MVYKNNQNVGDVIQDEIIVQCACNTHSFHIVTFDDDPEYYFELWTQAFYEDKNMSLFNRIKKRLKIIWFAITGKEYQLTEFCLTDKDIDNLIQGLQEVKNDKMGDDNQ